jgi:EmrB/QacA subfamily drug resistance transporter
LIMKWINNNKETRRPFVLAAVMLAMFMAAIEATIVATAMPSIVAELGGFSLFSWVFSVYLLMQVITIPIYGKLSDLFGRIPVFTVGVIIFLIGSILCGFAETMTMLIIFRLIQGVGAGAVQPIAMTIVGDMYSIEERAKIQGYLAGVWGVSSVIGPALGGFFVIYTDWAWVFWVNIPIGIISILGLLFFLKEDVEKKKHQIDFLGIGLLFVSIGALMIIFVRGGVAWPWFSMPIMLLWGLFILGFIAFIFQEKRALEPVVPLSIWKHPVIVVANVASLTSGALLMGVTTFLPTYVQGVMERTPMEAGFALAMMSIGWPLASTFAGRFMLKVGFRLTAICGGLMLIIGAVFFVVLRPEYGPVWAAAGSFMVGVGMGLATTTFVVSVQSSVEWKQRGVATASNMFMRTMGTAIGASLLGGILNTRMVSYFNDHPQQAELALDIDLINEVLEPETRSALSEQTVNIVQEGLTLSLRGVYIGVLILAVVSFLIILLWPKRSETR